MDLPANTQPRVAGAGPITQLPSDLSFSGTNDSPWCVCGNSTTVVRCYYNNDTSLLKSHVINTY